MQDRISAHQDNRDNAAFIIAYAACVFSGAIMGFGGGVLTGWLWWG